MPIIKKVKQCCECKNKFTFDKLTLFNGDDLCKDCLDQTTDVCIICGKRFDKDDIIKFDNKSWCENCFDDEASYCYNCEKRFYDSDLHEFNGDSWCQECLDAETNRCYTCGNRDYIEELYIRNGRSYCWDCWDELEDDECNTYYYPDNYTFYRLKSEPKDSLYYGIELETGVMHDAKFELNKLIAVLPEQFFARHEDGSIHTTGVVTEMEIVSHPMTYKWLMKHKSIWNKIFKFRNIGLLSYNIKTCGIHIHLTKKYFSEDHLYKFLSFVYNNKEFIKKISQRQQTALNQWAPLSIEHLGNLKNIAKEKYTDGKYLAVNLCHSDTMEIRFFRGTLNPESFWKNLEFTQALVEFSKKYDIEKMNVEDFVKYIKGNKNRFGNLYKFLINKELV